MSLITGEGPMEVYINDAFEKAGCKLSGDDVCHGTHLPRYLISQVEYLARFVEEDMEADDKREGFISMVEGFVEMVCWIIQRLS